MTLVTVESLASLERAGLPSAVPHRSAVVLFALAMGGFAIGTTEFSAMSLLPNFAADLKIDAPTAGHVISAYALGVVVGAPVLALCGAKWSRRSLLIALMSVFALANLLSAFAQSYGSAMLFRFLSGVPHGAYFGVAMLVAASVVPPGRRAQAVGWIMTGLTTSAVIGVPLATWLGQATGWRSAIALVALLAVFTVVLLWIFVPVDQPAPGASARRELSALNRPQVWLTLATGAIGFGGLFAVYAYLASTLMSVTSVSPSIIPLVLAIFGAGMIVGTLVTGWAADRALMPTIGGLLLWSAVSLALFPLAAGNVFTLALVVFMVGCGGGIGTALQTRLMDVAEDAQTLAAALNHSAFNVANALGPWLAGLAIAAGYGWTSTGWVGVALAGSGMVFWALSLALDRAHLSIGRSAPATAV